MSVKAIITRSSWSTVCLLPALSPEDPPYMGGSQLAAWCSRAPGAIPAAKVGDCTAEKLLLGGMVRARLKVVPDDPAAAESASGWPAAAVLSHGGVRLLF